MVDFYKAANWAEGTLAARLTEGGSRLQLNPSGPLISNFPVVGPYPIVVDEALSTREIITCSGKENNELVLIQRGAEGSAASEHQVGATVKLNITREYILELQAAVAAIDTDRAIERFLLAKAFNRYGHGIVENCTSKDCLVEATSPATMAVTVNTGYLLVHFEPFYIDEAIAVSFLSAPVTNPRIDLIEFDASTGNILVKMGNESVAPTPLTVDSTAIELAQVYLRPGMVSIKNEVDDDGTNGYAIDKRLLT